MHILDLILLICLVPAAIQGFSKGFITQLVAFIAVLVGAWVAYHFSSLASTFLQSWLEVSPAVLQIISFVLLFIVVVFVLNLIGKGLKALLKFAMLGWADKLLGVVLSLLMTCLVLGLLIILFNTINTKFELVSEEVLSQSVLYGPLRDIAYTVFPYFKELLVK
ncbi:MAG: CvpA family protein [Bacteroidales bacterium]|nr:CvpA family protein [Bacteroidales bacterium]